MGGSEVTHPLTSTDIKIERSFSNRPADGFTDFYDKMESYVNIISGPAIALYGANPLTFRSFQQDETSVFKIADTLTSKAGIADIVQKFSEETIAIIGLGGTGSYILDFLVKTPVNEIRGFDDDFYHVHNSFRSAGRMVSEELGKRKAEVFQNRYENFRHGISLQSERIDSESRKQLSGVTFAFICVDKGSSRKEIIDLLYSLNIPFIDVGMGLQRQNGTISGTLRTSFLNKGSNHEQIDKYSIPLTDHHGDVYRNSIQISELNALNAAIAVIKYKQIRGFYSDDKRDCNTVFTLDNSTMFGHG